MNFFFTSSGKKFWQNFSKNKLFISFIFYNVLTGHTVVYSTMYSWEYILSIDICFIFPCVSLVVTNIGHDGLSHIYLDLQ
jgi:hypothetical protein